EAQIHFGGGAALAGNHRRSMLSVDYGVGRGWLCFALARVAPGDLPQYLVEVSRLPEVAIDRGEAHISNGVEALQGIHDELADHGGGHLLLSHAFELAHDARDHTVDAFGLDRALAQRDLH